MARRYPKEKKEACRRAFVLENLGMRDISRLHDVPYDTLRAWRTKAKGTPSDWDRARRAQKVSTGGMDYVTRVVMDEFVPLLENTIRKIKTDTKVTPMQAAEMCSRLADSLTKTINSITRANPPLAKLGFAMDLLQEQVKWTRQYHPEKVDALISLLEGFGEHLGQLYG